MFAGKPIRDPLSVCAYLPSRPALSRPPRRITAFESDFYALPQQFQDFTRHFYATLEDP